MSARIIYNTAKSGEFFSNGSAPADVTPTIKVILRKGITFLPG